MQISGHPTELVQSYTSSTDNDVKSINKTESESQQSVKNQDTLHISKKAQSMSYLFMEASLYVAANKVPRYMPIERNQAVLDQAIDKVKDRAGDDFDEYTLKKMLISEQDILTEIKTFADFEPFSGNIYDFLTQDERNTIALAYDYAIDHDQNLRDVETGAAFIAIERNHSMMRNKGIIMPVHVQTEPLDEHPFYDPKLDDVNKPTTRDLLREKLLSGDLFKDNPFLDTPLFIKAGHLSLNVFEKAK